MLNQYVRDLKKEFTGYNTSKFMKDLLAGITVTAVALPLALAFGVSSGADAAAGLITAIVAGFFISALSGGYYQISGPTGAMAAILMSITASYHIQGVFIATLLAGILLLLAGVLHLGKITSWIPAPVITGFTSGIAIIIALGQVDNFFGVTSEGETAIARLISYFKLGFAPDYASVCLGIFVVLFMIFYPKKLSSIVPASLVAIILATMTSIVLQLDVKMVGEIPKTLLPKERLHLTDIHMQQIKGLFAPAVSIAMLGMIESLLCGASAGRMAKAAMNSDQELVAQGIGNIILPFFGGIPATAAIARTSVAIKSGAQTRLTGIFHAVGLLLAMFALGPFMSKIPLAALAGVLMVTAWRMNEWSAIQYIFSHKFTGAMLKFFITMAATVILDLTMAIVIGILVGLVLFIVRSTAIEITAEDIKPERIGMKDYTIENGCVIYVTGPMFFMTADTLNQKLKEIKEKNLVIFSLRGVPMADITSVGILLDFYKQAKTEGKQVVFSSLQPSVRRIFEQAGLVETAGEKTFYFSVDKVLKEMLVVNAKPVKA
ncbi:sulfate permease [Anaerocolumna cellulosilytica]|uniref:Sulfate permease n=1 Tax=Anaerocolumna cellulosilytica TaxID=433286 RepID=A0A6S6R3R7_9FIRM|nr:SulP family inorganic anion transporter [Anaerocolumna cellulosilytica]MBB5195283.1 SulP family sulfate permease [Anaerocolumna cellulosilytica]BCJ96756.1 sulfate permease [Anaerocolumna cellulosilytica]